MGGRTCEWTVGWLEWTVGWLEWIDIFLRGRTSELSCPHSCETHIKRRKSAAYRYTTL